jgi:solute carrier family 44 (choline transporter-like protein), member 2/4/5
MLPYALPLALPCRDNMTAACSADPNCYITYEWDNKMKYAFLYHFFGLLWTNQVLVGISCVTIAGG